MITDVPSAAELRERAQGWMSLAWRVVLGALDSYKAFEDYYLEEGEFTPEETDTARQSYWDRSRFNLNNAISLLQQSLELFLKSFIAEVSPYLLIADEPLRWKSDAQGNVAFPRLRTVDASQLCRLVSICTERSVSDAFKFLYDRLRTHRNVIVHLGPGNMRVEAEKILADILLAHTLLFPNESWVQFRSKTLAGEKYMESPYSVDWTHSNLMAEVDTALRALTNGDARRFFGCDKRKRRYVCPTCFSRKTKYDENDCRYMEGRRDESYCCFVCGTSIGGDDYRTRCTEEVYDSENWQIGVPGKWR